MWPRGPQDPQSVNKSVVTCMVQYMIPALPRGSIAALMTTWPCSKAIIVRFSHRMLLAGFMSIRLEDSRQVIWLPDDTHNYPQCIALFVQQIFVQ